MAAGGGLPLEERQGRSADPACAEAAHAGAGPGPASPGRNFNSGHQPSPQGPRPDGPRTAEVEETYMACRGFGKERHDAPGSAVGKDSDEALHRTFEYVVVAGNQFRECGRIDREIRDWEIMMNITSTTKFASAGESTAKFAIGSL